MELKKEKLTEALLLLRDALNVIIPVSGDGAPVFRLWDGVTEPCLVANTSLPPKDLLFPRSEKMYDYNVKTGDVSEISSNEKQAVFGIRPCDVRSIENLDRAFLENGYTDSYYKTKRDGLTTIAVACTEAARTCFCDSMGVSPDDAPAADVVLNDCGSAYAVKSNTEKGETVTRLWKPLLTKGAGKAAKAADKVVCDFKARADKDLPEKLVARFDDPMWDKLSKACLGCGCCSFICPTCYCFDIGRENHGAEGTAFRCWDSCMFSDYSRMAGGHDPRPSKKERLRNRYLHKLAYFNLRYGVTLCVGCGRCVDKCPANLDVTKAMDIISEGVRADG
jgi:ferredoxin